MLRVSPLGSFANGANESTARSVTNCAELVVNSALIKYKYHLTSSLVYCMFTETGDANLAYLDVAGGHPGRDERRVGHWS
jgi:hypothetical protein